MEYVVIAVVALLVVGPERLPAMLNKLGKMVGKARAMANDFRSSFDEMARQSELDDLRKEVDALRRGQSNMMPLGAEAEATFRSIRDDLNKPVHTALPTADAGSAPALTGPDEWPDSPPVLEPLEEAPAPAPAPAAAPQKTKAPAKKPAAKKTATTAAAKPKAARKKVVEL
ncbi:Sec-independent protein translocase protein TatB [Brevundimonas lenta]|uniref:Sec-independent protein translocase protein TatB n=1 Tax=Brevundimonas lenta TaxID=424796 RepID=A0A7W6JE06_9CAUL|nr:sec-independent protein translocase protein TatB [Brevundimonas lenta]